MRTAAMVFLMMVSGCTADEISRCGYACKEAGGRMVRYEKNEKTTDCVCEYPR